MNVKRIVMTGALVLVVAGCIIAAGCTQSDSSEDPIVGIWAGDGVKYVTETHVFIANGTGYSIVNYLDGSTGIDELKWTKNDDGTYVVKECGGLEDTWTVDAGKTAKSKRENNSYVLKALDGTAAKAIGCWYNADNHHVATFNADGSGTYYKGSNSTKFSWTDLGSGKLRLHMLDGVQKDADYDWTYDTETDTFTSPHDIVYSRPLERVDGFDLSRFIIETPADQIVGQWTTKYQIGGKTVDAVMTLRKDGEGYWMALGDVEGIQLTAINKDTWKKTGENTYQVTGSSGRVYEEVYDPVACTLTEDGTTVYTRLDPIVGIWHGQTASGDGGEISTIIKPDGTGVGTVSYDNGTSEVSKLTWKKNSDGTYAVAYSTGYTATYTVDSAGTRIVSSSGSVKEKAFLDSTFLMSIVGAWYNQDKDASYVFNADGTGFGFANGGMMPFTWKLKELGEFELAYTDEAASVDSGIAGKTFVWTYDRDNNVFISSAGTKYIRPAESVNGKITLFS